MAAWDSLYAAALQDPDTMAWVKLHNGSTGDYEDSCVTPGVIFSVMGGNASESVAGTLEALDGGFSDVVFATCGLSAAILLASFVFHLCWLYRTEHKEVTFKRGEQFDKLVHDLVMHFAPLVAVDGYRFKGMRGSDCGAKLDFEDLGLTLKSDGRTVLQGVTGSIGKGKMAAIMGPSGCGKTTFMNTLCGKSTYGNMTGEVRVNGMPGSFSRLKNIMGFVPQDDVVHESLTVREQIEFSAKLRNERTLTRAEIADIVEDVLHVLQIGHIQRSIVGGVERRGISGGQRKRVNIGLELAANPVLLFLDEPTSGLDSTSSLMIVNALKKMTDIGMTIVMVIHQPRYSLFTLFDQVLLLGVGGRTVYLGSPEGAVGYFDGMGFKREPMDNPADWLMDVISGEVACARFPDFRREHLVELWDANAEQYSEGHAMQTSPQAREQRRMATAANSLSLLRTMIAQEWETFDPHGAGCLSRHEMRGFLASCVQQQVDPEVWEDLLSAIGGLPEGTRRLPRGNQEALIWKDNFDDFMKEQFEGMVVRRLPSYAGRSGELSPIASEMLENRSPPGPCRQWIIICHRRLVQFWRDWVKRVLNILLFCICASCFAAMQRGTAGTMMEISMCHMGLAMVLSVSVLQTFADRPVLWREASSGVSIVSLYLARICVSMIDALCLTILYAFVYWMVVDADCKFHIYLFPLLGLGWAVSAWGYFFSVTVSPKNAVLVTLVVTLILTQVVGKFTLVINNLQSPVIHLLSISPTRWSVPMQFVLNVEAKGGALRGIPIPEPPSCSDVNTTNTECDQLSNVTSAACLLATDIDKCVAEEEDECQLASAKAADDVKSKRLQSWLAEKSNSEYGRWAFSLLTDNASWSEDGLKLLFTGIILHALSFLCLLQQSPAATSAKENLAIALGHCGSRRRRDDDGDAESDEGSNSTDSSDPLA